MATSLVSETDSDKDMDIDGYYRDDEPNHWGDYSDNDDDY